MPEIQPLRRKPRKLTKFLCQELLYDYMTGHLDADRKKAVEEYLSEHPEMRVELKEMAEAVSYCDKLSQTKLSDELTESLAQVRLASEVVAEKVAYRNWPDLLKWSTEATIISVCVAGIAMVVPWNSIRTVFERPSSEHVILADVEKKIDEKDVDVPSAAPIFIGPPKPPGGEAPAATAAPVAVAPKATPIPAPTATPTPVLKVIAKTDEVKPNPNDKRGQPKGLLYRIMMNHANIRTLAPTISDRIRELGGKKAGQVEIGWRKSNGNYFHFAMPEKEYQKLISTLGGYGPVRIYKSPHERVMPAGSIRIILWVEDAPGASGESGMPSDSMDTSAPADGAEIPADEGASSSEQ
jgi:hypothetical protein